VVIDAIMLTMVKEGKTTISISKETAEALAKLGKKGDTYDDIIKALLRKAGK
jgi:hypothetical protein